MTASTANDVPTPRRIPPAATVALRPGPADVHGPSLQLGAIQPLNGGHRVRNNRVWTLNTRGEQGTYWNAGNCGDVQQDGNIFADRSLTPDIFDEIPSACR